MVVDQKNYLAWPRKLFRKGVYPYSLREGALLVEILLGTVLFGLFVSAAYLTLLTGQESSQTGAARTRGVYLTEQALEVAKDIRYGAWNDLVAGKKGFTLNDSGQWILSGSDLTRYNYGTYMLIDTVDSVTKRVHARSAWKHGYFRSGATALSVELTNWRTNDGVGDWSNPTLTGSITFPQALNFNDIVRYKDYVYVTSEVGAVGDGLYIFDVSDETNPTRVSSSFNLDGTAHKPVAYKDRLYVAVEAGVQDEVQAFDISSPTTLNGSTAPLVTYNLEGGDNRALSLALDNNVLLVGSEGHAGQPELTALDTTTGSMLTLLGELDITGNPNIYNVSVHGDYALLSTDYNTTELIVADISDPTNMSVHSTYNATSVADAYGGETYGTGFYLARENGATDEYVLILGSGGVASTNPAKVFGASIGGSVNAMDVDPLGCYAFLATDNSSKELQVRSARYKSVAEESYADHTTGAGRGVYYDAIRDSLYLATESGFYIYDPGSPSTCQ